MIYSNEHNYTPKVLFNYAIKTHQQVCKSVRISLVRVKYVRRSLRNRILILDVYRAVTAFIHLYFSHHYH